MPLSAKSQSPNLPGHSLPSSQSPDLDLELDQSSPARLVPPRANSVGLTGRDSVQVLFRIDHRTQLLIGETGILLVLSKPEATVTIELLFSLTGVGVQGVKDEKKRYSSFLY